MEPLVQPKVAAGGTDLHTFDARLAADPVAGGYTRRLAEGLAELLGPDLVLLIDPLAGWTPPPGPRPVRLAGPVDSPASVVRLGAAAPLGLLHIPHTAGPLWHRGPLVVTVHDPVPLLGRRLGRLRLLGTLVRSERIVVPDTRVAAMLRHLAPTLGPRLRVLGASEKERPRDLARRHLEVYEEAREAHAGPPWP